METILNNHSDYFETSFFVIDMLRSLGYGLVKILRDISEACLSLFDQAYELLNFTQYKKVDNFINDFQPIFIVLLMASLCFLGITLIISSERPNKILRNVLLSLLVISSGTLLMQKLNTALISGKDAIGISAQSTSADVIKDNLVDLLYVDKQNQLSEFPVHYNTLSEPFIKNLNISETVTKKTKGISETAKEVFSNYIAIDENGDIEYKEFKKGFLDIFDPPYYYRFNINFPVIYITYITLIIAYICSSYKVVRLIYELVIHNVLAFLYAAEITNGQKLLKIVDSIKNTYIVLFLVTVFLKIYTLFSSYISSSDFNTFVKSFFLIFATFAVIDGPNIVEKITGIDAGLSSGFGKMAAAYTMGRSMTRGASSLAFGNPATGRGGLLKNNYTKAAGAVAKEGFGAGKDVLMSGIGYGAGKAMGGIKNEKEEPRATSSEHGTSGTPSSGNGISGNRTSGTLASEQGASGVPASGISPLGNGDSKTSVSGIAASGNDTSETPKTKAAIAGNGESENSSPASNEAEKNQSTIVAEQLESGIGNQPVEQAAGDSMMKNFTGTTGKEQENISGATNGSTQDSKQKNNGISSKMPIKGEKLNGSMKGGKEKKSGVISNTKGKSDMQNGQGVFASQNIVGTDGQGTLTKMDVSQEGTFQEASGNGTHSGGSLTQSFSDEKSGMIKNEEISSGTEEEQKSFFGELLSERKDRVMDIGHDLNLGRTKKAVQFGYSRGKQKNRKNNLT